MFCNCSCLPITEMVVLGILLWEIWSGGQIPYHDLQNEALEDQVKLETDGILESFSEGLMYSIHLLVERRLSSPETRKVPWRCVQPYAQVLGRGQYSAISLLHMHDSLVYCVISSMQKSEQRPMFSSLLEELEAILKRAFGLYSKFYLQLASFT